MAEVNRQEYEEYQVFRWFTFYIKLWVPDSTVCLMGYSKGPLHNDKADMAKVNKL